MSKRKSARFAVAENIVECLDATVAACEDYFDSGLPDQVSEEFDQTVQHMYGALTIFRGVLADNPPRLRKGKGR